MTRRNLSVVRVLLCKWGWEGKGKVRTTEWVRVCWYCCLYACVLIIVWFKTLWYYSVKLHVEFWFFFCFCFHISPFWCNFAHGTPKDTWLLRLPSLKRYELLITFPAVSNTLRNKDNGDAGLAIYSFLSPSLFTEKRIHCNQLLHNSSHIVILSLIWQNLSLDSLNWESCNYLPSKFPLI